MEKGLSETGIEETDPTRRLGPLQFNSVRKWFITTGLVAENSIT
jgi:hypothetical protein